MSKGEAQKALGKCKHCGANMDLAGLKHNCRPRKKLPPMEHPEGEPIVEAVLSDPRVERVSVAEVLAQQGHAVSKRKGGSVEVVQAATDVVIDKFAAGKVKLTIRIDKELMKEIKIDAVETDQTIEAWVEAAIRQELKARRA